MTNFVKRALQIKQSDFPVRSLLDVDFYKITMLYFVWKYFPTLKVKYECINRAVNIPVVKIVDEKKLRNALDFVRGLRFNESELNYLFTQQYYGANMFSADFIQFLRELSLPEYKLSVADDQYILSFEGDWIEVELWETIALAAVFQLYSNSLLSKMTEVEIEKFYANGVDKLQKQLFKLKEFPDIHFADFGSRRRHNFLWHKQALEMATNILGNQLLGTSDVFLAKQKSLKPIGTNAHSITMALVARKFGEMFKNNDYEGIVNQQYKMLDLWQNLYKDDSMRIFLPDTYGTKQFLENAPEWLAHKWKGVRQDSGNPFEIGEIVLDWYKQHGIKDPKSAGKIIIFSDGLAVDLMIELQKAFRDRINVGFGWGTHFTNGLDGCYPNPDKLVPDLESMLWGEVKWAFSLVCKVVASQGNPAVKLPDNLKKATGPKAEQERYMEVFGRESRSSYEVVV